MNYLKRVNMVLIIGYEKSKERRTGKVGITGLSLFITNEKKSTCKKKFHQSLTPKFNLFDLKNDCVISVPNYSFLFLPSDSEQKVVTGYGAV